MTSESRVADGWKEYRKQQVRDILRTTPARRLAWVEETIDFLREAGFLKRSDGRA